MEEAKDVYSFELVGTLGERLHFPTYRAAFTDEMRGDEPIWFWDGEKDCPVAHLEGQEAFGVGW